MRPSPTRITSPPASRAPGDLLLSPVALVALAVVIVNDRVLKAAHPSVVTGKLSDLAGLVYFPLFVVAAAEALRRLRGRSDWELTWRAVALVAVVTGAVFAAIKCWPPAATAYGPTVGALVWPAQAVASSISGGGLPPLAPAPLVMDPSDLVALPMLVVSVLVARRVMGTGARRPAVAGEVTQRSAASAGARGADRPQSVRGMPWAKSRTPSGSQRRLTATRRSRFCP